MLTTRLAARPTQIASVVLVLGTIVVGVLAGVATAIDDAAFNARFGDPTLIYHARVASASVAEFLLLAAPGIFLTLRGYRAVALIPSAILAVGRAVNGFEHGFGLALAIIWLVLAVAPALVLMRAIPEHQRVRLPSTLWTLAAIAGGSLISWYVEVLFSPDGRLASAPVAYVAFLAFGLLLGTPPGWLTAHGILLGLAMTANGIAYGWIGIEVPITPDRWSLASLIGAVLVGLIGSAVHRVTLTEATPTVVWPRTTSSS